MLYLFCNIKWMEFYCGHETGVEEGIFEIYNFANQGNQAYGFVEFKRGGNINLNRISHSAKADKIGNVFVIWVARHPKGGSYVVGWYRNATVFRKFQHFNTLPPKLYKSLIGEKNDEDGYRIRAKFADVKLLPIDERTIPMLKGKLRSGIWYGNEDGRKLAEKVFAYANKKVKKSKPIRYTDPEHNKKVEKAAVKKVRNYYEDLGYSLTSLEEKKIGWDLEAELKNIKLRIEVKGLSGSVATVHLSANEYKAFSEKFKYYRLAIVTDALTASPNLIICRYSQGREKWVDKADTEIEIEIRQSAIIRVPLTR